MPLANGRFQKVWITPGQAPAQGTPVGAPYTRQPANQVNIDQKAESASEQEHGKAVGQDIAGTVQQAATAPQALGQIAMMREAVSRAGNNMTTGPFAQGVLRAKHAIGGTLGIELPGTSEAEVVNNLGFGLARQAARAISNRPTQFEFGKARDLYDGWRYGRNTAALAEMLTRPDAASGLAAIAKAPAGSAPSEGIAAMYLLGAAANQGQDRDAR